MSDSKIAKDLIRPDDGTVEEKAQRRPEKATAEMKIENLALLRCVTHLLKPPLHPQLSKWSARSFWPRL